MLELILGTGGVRPLFPDDYVLIRKASGQDTLRFQISRRDPAARFLTERVPLRETTTGQIFLLTGLDAGQRTVTCDLKKDLTDWQKTVLPGYTNGRNGATAEETLRGVLPSGWSLTMEEPDTLSAKLELQGPTPLGVLQQCGEVYGCGYVFDNRGKTLTVCFPGRKTLGTAFVTETANLRAAPEFKSKAGDIVTRLYAQGAGGVEFTEINDGKPYVECFDFTEEVIAGLWRDERFTIPEHLLAAAKQRIRALCRPQRTWTLQVADLRRMEARPLTAASSASASATAASSSATTVSSSASSAAASDTWPGLRLELFDVITLVDPTLSQKLEVQIQELRLHPHYPEKNEIAVTERLGTLRTLPETLRELGVRS